MKNVYTVLLAVAMLMGFDALACKREGSFTGKEGETVTGTAKIEADAQGKLTLYLEGFQSTPGPDLDVYLTKSGKPSSDPKSVNLGALKFLAAGTQSYVLPDSIKLDDFDNVSIHCTKWNHWYGEAQLGAKTGDCSTLSTGKPKAIDVNAFQTGNSLSINVKNGFNGSVQLTDLQGKLLYQSSTIQSVQNTFSVPVSHRGVVILNLVGKEGVASKKLVVR